MVERSHKGLVLKEIKVKRGGKTFTQKRWVKVGKDDPAPKEGKKEVIESKGKFNIGDIIRYRGENFEVEKISESEQTVKISGIIYTFDAANKMKETPEREEEPKEKTIKDLKVPKEKVAEKKVISDKKSKPKVVITKPEKEIKLTPNNFKDILIEGKWINVDGKSAIITKIEMDMFVTYRLENGKDESTTTFELFSRDVKSEDKTSPIPDKFVFKPVKSEKIVKGKMELENVESIKSLKDMDVEGGVNESTTNVVKFKDGSQAIYKTGGSVSTQGEMNFKGISKILGWDNAPETVETDLGNGNGSSQRWVENIAIDDINEVKLTKKHYDDLAKIAIIDMITGNWDRHYNNVRLDTDGKIWAIDNDTWGDETQYNINDVSDNFYTCKLGNWSGVGKKENQNEFQTYCNKYIKSVVEHKDEITKFINDIGSDKTKFKDNFKSGFDGGFGDTYKSVDDLTNNMLKNLNRVTGDDK